MREKDKKPPHEHLLVPSGMPFSEATSGKGRGRLLKSRIPLNNERGKNRIFIVGCFEHISYPNLTLSLAGSFLSFIDIQR